MGGVPTALRGHGFPTCPPKPWASHATAFPRYCGLTIEGAGGAGCGGTGTPDTKVGLAEFNSLGCNCSGVGKTTSWEAVPEPVPAAAALLAAVTVTLTVMGLGMAGGLAKLIVRFKAAAHWSFNHESIASAPVLSLNL